MSTSSVGGSGGASSSPITALKSRRVVRLEYPRQKNTREAERTRGKQRVGKCETREIVLPLGRGGVLGSSSRGWGEARAERGEISTDRQRVQTDGNCYPIESH